MEVKGRYPVSEVTITAGRPSTRTPCILRPKNMEVGVQYHDGYVVLRVDDEQYPDFWLEITLSADEVRDMVNHIN